MLYFHMQVSTPSHKKSAVPEFVAGGGELGEMIRNYDWASTSLGPLETWPQSLRTCIRIMLTSRQPIWIGWGKELIKFYNDPYKEIVGGKHPWALGKPASEVWKDIWKDIDPMLRQVMEEDTGTYVESQLLIMERNGYPEETYYTFSYTPIPGDDGKTAGMFCANTDDTDRIISERQLKTLTRLGKSLTDSKSNEEIISKTMRTLADNPWDFPFAIFRTIEDNKAIKVASTDLGKAADLIPDIYDLSLDNEISNIIKQSFATRKVQVFEHLQHKVGELPKGGWSIPPDKVIVLPIAQSGTKEPYGLLTIGLNPYRLLDEKYLSFFTLVADQIATSFADVHVLEEERKRSEALAELDRAKTTFFSNISHEFRTPLTLLLGPMEEVMADEHTIPVNKIRVETAYRNALRMQKLVNTLLDFSKIEAGRLEGKFSKVDICTLTQDLASTFRSAIEKAGMQLLFNCDPIKDDVYVDVDMWEKIVLNLVSNAFKYSNDGSISVKIQQHDAHIQLEVTDTGVGIPAEHIEKIFDRFHRVDNTQGRSQEGTGIGLAMVKELVKQHHGTITASSAVGKGSTFTVTIPVGKDHLPAEKIISEVKHHSSLTSAAYVQEAGKWVDKVEHNLKGVEDAERTNHTVTKAKVLVADDNADMREYIDRLLADKFDVITARDGEDALEKAASLQPDLLISDIMMPKLDGFGLLRKLRQHPDLKSIPVIFLSARAGEEAKIEGLEAGADDYLVKPFAAKELIARVEGNIKIAKSRIAAENNLRNIITQAPVAMAILKGEDHVMEIANEKALEIWGKTYEQTINRKAFDIFPELVSQGFKQILDNVLKGERFVANELPLELIKSGEKQTLYVSFTYEPLANMNGDIEGIAVVGIDVTQQVISRKEIEKSEKELNQLANAMPQLVWVASKEGNTTYYNERVSEFLGAKKTEEGIWRWEGMLHEDDVAITESAWKQSLEQGNYYQVQHRIRMKDGSYRWHLSRAYPYKDENGNILKWFGTATDIHTQKEYAAILEEEVKNRTCELQEMNESLQESNNELQQFAHVASHDLKEPLRKIKTFTSRLAEDGSNVLSERSGTFLNKINSAAERMQSMIDGVLNYSTLNAAAQKPETIELDKVVNDIENDLEILIQQTGATINRKALPALEGAPILIYQLFYNLVYNALKFAKPEVTPVVNIHSTETKVDDRSFIQITVSDNGIGFRQEYAEKIFETFARLNPKDRFEGTGLGLSLCRRIVERHGGTITASGKEGAGASFVINLPAKQQQQMI